MTEKKPPEQPHSAGCPDHLLVRCDDGRWDLVEHGEVTYTQGPGMNAAMDRLVLRVLDEYDDLDECSWSKYESLDGTLCVHHAAERVDRYKDRPLRTCRQAMREVFLPREGDA